MTEPKLTAAQVANNMKKAVQSGRISPVVALRVLRDRCNYSASMAISMVRTWMSEASDGEEAKDD